MKTFISFIIIFILFSFQNSLPAQSKEDTFSQNFIDALASENIDELVKLKPDADFWKIILDKETKGMTDEEINLKANKNEKFIQDYENIMYSAKKEHIDLKKIKFKKVKIIEIWEDENMPLDMTIKFTYEEENGKFGLSVYKHEGTYYLSEIHESFDIFSQLK